jgi:proline iminopeptidase
MLRKAELDWFYQEGASAMYPDRWEDYLEPIPPAERGNLVRAFHRRLTGVDRSAAVAAARAWAIWEGSTSYLLTDDENVRKWGEDEFALAVARIECHYFVKAGHAAEPAFDDIGRIRHLLAAIVQGRHDVVCPMTTAGTCTGPGRGDFRVIADAGHSAFGPASLTRWCATDRFAS